MFRNKDTIIKQLQDDNREYIKQIVNLGYDRNLLLIVFDLLNRKEELEDVRYFLLYMQRSLGKNPFLSKELYLIEGLYDKLCEYIFYDMTSIKLLVVQILCVMIDVAKLDNVSGKLVMEIGKMLEHSSNPQTILISLENRNNEMLINSGVYNNICELMFGNCIPYVCNLCARILLRLSEDNESLVKECIVKNYKGLDVVRKNMPFVEELLKLVN